MTAPDKIYLDEDIIKFHVLSERLNENDICYIRKDILQIPKWKKTKPERGKAFGIGPWYPHGFGQDGGKHIVFFNGYEISVDELFDKLPKEE